MYTYKLMDFPISCYILIEWRASRKDSIGNLGQLNNKVTVFQLHVISCAVYVTLYDIIISLLFQHQNYEPLINETTLISSIVGPTCEVLLTQSIEPVM